MSEQDKRWDAADRISDRIVDIVNEELDTMRKAESIDPLGLLAGQLLALLALVRTAPAIHPPSFAAVADAAQDCLREILQIAEHES